MAASMTPRVLLCLSSFLVFHLSSEHYSNFSGTILSSHEHSSRGKDFHGQLFHHQPVSCCQVRRPKAAKPNKITRFLERVGTENASTSSYALIASLAPDTFITSLLVFSGDIELNPGPPSQRRHFKFPCGICKRPVKCNQRGICCDICSEWTHANCCQLTADELFSLSDRSRGWICQSCHWSSLPFSNVQDSLDDSQHDKTAPSVPSQPVLNPPSTDTSPPSFWYTNCRSIRNKLPEFHHQLHSSPATIHALTETWLDDSLTDEELVCSADFSIFRKDRGSRGGGVLLAVPGFIPSIRRSDLEVTDLELLWVEIRNACRSWLIGVFYRPPQNGMHEAILFEESLTKVISNSKQPRNILLVGDFNMPLDWSLPHVSSSSAHHLKIIDALSFANLTQICTSPSYTTLKGEKHFLDLVFVKQTVDFLDCCLGDNIGSDHAALSVNFRNKIRDTSPKESKRVFLFHKGNFNDLKAALSCINWDFILDTPDTNEALSSWSDIFLAAVSDTFPSKTLPVKSKKLPWSTPEISKLSTLKRKLFKRYKENMDQITLTQAKDTQRKLKKLIRSSYQNHLNALSSLSKSSPKHFWARVTKLRRNSTNLTLRRGSNFTTDKSEIANIFLDQFSKHFHPPPLDAGKLDSTSSSQDNIGVTNAKMEPVHCTPELVLKALHKIDPSGSTGPDGIPPRVIRECAAELAPSLSLLYNKILSSGVFPAVWKNAWTLPLFKGNKLPRDDPTSYRPIAITSILCRTLERIINDQLTTYLEDNKILSPSQFGFRSGRACEHALTKLTSSWSEALDELPAPAVDVILFDFCAAFDQVDHRVLLRKLRRIGIDGALLSFITGFLSNRSFQVLYKSQLSKVSMASRGVPQGSVLGPVLFNIFLADLPHALDVLNIVFADDLTISLVIRKAADKTNLQKAIDYIHRWSIDNGLPLNTTKCKTLRITRAKNLGVPHQYQLDNKPLPIVQSARILGVVFNSSLTAHDHINTTCARANRLLGFCIRLTASCSDCISFSTLYTALVLPLLDYCSPVWDPHQSNLTDRIEAIQRKASSHAWRLSRGTTTSVKPPYLNRLKALKWRTLSFRRQSSKMLLYMKILASIVPPDTGLSDFLRLSIRTNNPTPQLARTNHHSHSFFLSCTRTWLALPNLLTSAPLTSLTDIRHTLRNIKSFWTSQNM